MSFFNEVYGSWQDKQASKYEELVPKIEDCFRSSETVLDIGVGKAWLWTYLMNKGFDFKWIDGVDVSRRATEPELDEINYFYINASSQEFSINSELERDTYDLLVAFDSIHLVEYGKELLSLICDGGFLLQAVPLKFQSELKKYEELEVIKEGEIGEEELDRYLLQVRE